MPGPTSPVAAHTNEPPNQAYTKVYDYSGSDLIYEGWAYSDQGQAAGAPATSAAIWAITKYTYVTSQVTKQEWANAGVKMNNIWDNRAALSYQ